MNYWVTRGGQQYGPYSLADLQRYVASGNILPTDMARNESMSQWLPVSQILASGGGQAPQPPAPQPAAPQPMAPQQPQPMAQHPQPMAPQQPQPHQPQPHMQQPQPQHPQMQPMQPAVQQPPYGQSGPQQPYGGQQPMYSQPGGAMPQQPMPVQGGPLPPGMEWWLVLIIAIFTCGIFSLVWMFIQANFVKQIRPASQALMFYAIGAAGFLLIGLVFISRELAMLAPLINLGCSVMLILGHFKMKASIEEYYNTVEPINLRLSGVMVFFFNVFYFQYHFARIRKWKTTGVWQQ